MIKVSIIITCHNLERHVVRAINSCINQDFPHYQYEIIIVDDASTDKSKEVISLYEGFAGYHFIVTKYLKKNRGVAFASNEGIKLARGKYIVRVDGDDYIHKDFIGTMSEVLDWNKDIGMVYCDLIVVQGEGAKSHRKFQRNTFERLLDHGAGVMFRKSYLNVLGGYDVSLKNCEDYDLLLRYTAKYQSYHLRLPYYRYFKNGKGLSSHIVEREAIKKRVRQLAEQTKKKVQ